jgi:hypothetical protein
MVEGFDVIGAVYAISAIIPMNIWDSVMCAGSLVKSGSM